MSALIIIEHPIEEKWRAAIQNELPDELIEVYPHVKDPETVDFVITFKPRKAALKEFPNIKVIQSLGAGVNNIIETNALTADMTLARIVDPFLAEDMWEFTLAVVLSEIKNLPKYQEQKAQSLWKPSYYKRFRDTTIGILGLGKIGSCVATNFAKLGFQVKGWSNSPKDIEGVDSYFGKEQLSNALKEVDFLINILPLTEATEGILTTSTLEMLPKGAFLMNVGRGPHNDEAAIMSMLDREHLSGTLLDVFHQEPLPAEHPFWQHPKIKITPHVASLTNRSSAAVLIADNYRRFKAGKQLANVVSLEKGY